MTSQPTAEVFQRDRDPLGNNDFIQVRQNTSGIFISVSVNKLWCRSSCKDVGWNKTHAPRSCYGLSKYRFLVYCGTFLTDFLPKLSRPVMAEALILAHETVCDRTDWIRILWFQHWPRLFSRLMHDAFYKNVQAVIESLRAGNTTKILCFLHVLRGQE